MSAMANQTVTELPQDLHPEYHMTSSAMLQDIVIGLSDGLTVPFALAAGLSGAVASSGLVITAGLAEIVAGSIAMGLGGYLAGRTEVEHYEAEQARERNEVREVPDVERAEVDELLAAMGLSAETRQRAVAELTADPEQWVKFMMKYELGLEEPDPKQAPKSAVTISMAYAVGGLIPLSAYFVTSTPTEGLGWSAAITLVCLLVFGYFKSRMTGQPPVAGAVKMAVVGALAAAAAFGIARVVGG
jgi:VIT1/CCC1 family predicted Fe2+/Mn2+ transporter